MQISTAVHDLVDGLFTGRLQDTAFLDGFEDLRDCARQSPTDLPLYTTIDMLISTALWNITPTCDLKTCLQRLTRA